MVTDPRTLRPCCSFGSRNRGATRSAKIDVFHEDEPAVFLRRDPIVRHRVVYEVLFVFRDREAVACGAAGGFWKRHVAFPKRQRAEDLVDEVLVDEGFKFAMGQQIGGAGRRLGECRFGREGRAHMRFRSAMLDDRVGFAPPAEILAQRWIEAFDPNFNDTRRRNIRGVQIENRSIKKSETLCGCERRFLVRARSR